MASPSAGAPALKYGDVNTVTLSPCEVKGLINGFIKLRLFCKLLIKQLKGFQIGNGLIKKLLFGFSPFPFCKLSAIYFYI